MKINRKILISIILVIITIFALTSSAFADIDPADYYPDSDVSQNGNFLSKAGKVIGWIQFIGILVAVLTLTVIGIKYIFSSVEEKAEYKKQMLPYILGCFMIIGISVIIGIIESISTGEISGGVPTDGGGSIPHTPGHQQIDLK